MTSVEASRIERLRDGAVRRACHCLHLGIRIVGPVSRIRRRGVGVAPGGEPAITSRRRAARITLLLVRLAPRLVHAQHPNRAFAPWSVRRENQVLPIRRPARVAALRARRRESCRRATTRRYDPHFTVIFVIALVDRLHGECDARAIRRHGRSTECRELVPIRGREGALCLSLGDDRSNEGSDSRQRPAHDATP